MKSQMKSIIAALSLAFPLALTAAGPSAEEMAFYKPYKFVYDRVEMIAIDPVVHACKDAFFKFDRIGLPPYVMPITTTGELWNYFRQDSPVKSFRAKRGLRNAEFYCCIDNGIEGIATGVASLKDIFLMNSMLVSAKRLQCETIEVSPKWYSE